MPIFDLDGNPIEEPRQSTAGGALPTSRPSGALRPRRQAESGYDGIIDAAASANDLDPNLIRAVIGQESGGNRNAVSHKGAGGLMQLMPATAKRFGVSDRFDPEQNIHGGARYLKFLSDRYGGDLSLTLAAYNAGEGAVDRHGGVPPYRETQDYVRKIMGRYSGGGGDRPKAGISSSEWGQWQNVGPAPVQPTSEGITWGDRGRAVMAGFANIPTTLGTGLEMAGRGLDMPAVESFGSGMREIGSDAEDYWHQGMSAEAQNPDTLWGKIQMSTAESLPGVMAMAIPSMGAAGLLAKLGAGERVASALTSIGANAKRAEMVGAGVESAVPASGIEGVFSALQNAAQTGDEARKAGEPEEVARQAELDVFKKTLPWTAGTSLATGGGVLGALAGRAAGRPTGGFFKEVLGGMGKEAGQEGLQSGGETYIQNTVAGDRYDPNRQPWQGVPESVLVGAGSGGMLGGLGGAASHFAGGPAVQPAPAPGGRNVPPSAGSGVPGVPGVPSSGTTLQPGPTPPGFDPFTGRQAPAGFGETNLLDPIRVAQGALAKDQGIKTGDIGRANNLPRYVEGELLDPSTDLAPGTPAAGELPSPFMDGQVSRGALPPPGAALEAGQSVPQLPYYPEIPDARNAQSGPGILAGTNPRGALPGPGREQAPAGTAGGPDGGSAARGIGGVSGLGGTDAGTATGSAAVESGPALTKVRDYYGTTHLVYQKDLDSTIRTVGVADSTGHRIGGILRANIIQDQTAPTPYFADFEVIGTKPTPKYPNGRAFSSYGAAKAFQTKQFLQQTHTISPYEGGGFVLTKKQQSNVQTQNPAAQPKASEAAEVDRAAHQAATSPNNDLPQPTDGQKKAGNYAKGHLRLHGLDISVENPKGSKRSGTDRAGKKWSVTMRHHYGYFKGTIGRDKDHIDTFIGPKPESAKVFVVNQTDPATGKFDEHKVMLGFPSLPAAKAGYLANYAKGWKGLSEIHETTIDQFKDWLKNGDTTKPYAPTSATRPTDRPKTPAETGVTPVAGPARPVPSGVPAKTAKGPGSASKPPITDADSLFQAIGKLGGISTEEAKQQGIDSPYYGGGKTALKGHGIQRVFQSKGLSFDDMATQLAQFGQFSHIGGANDLLVAISDAINAKERGHAGSISELERQAREHEEAEQQRADEERARLSEDQQRFYDALSDMEAIDPKGREAFVNKLDEDGFYDWTDAAEKAEAEVARLRRLSVVPEASERGAVQQRVPQPAAGATDQTQGFLTAQQGPTQRPKPAASTAVQADAFGGKTDTEQAIHDLKLEKDKKRNGTRDVPAGQDGGIFSSESSQVDIAETAKIDTLAPSNQAKADETEKESVKPAENQERETGVFSAVSRPDVRPDSAKPPAEDAKMAELQAEMDDVLADLGSIFLDANIFAKKVVPDDLNELKLMPVLARVMDVAFRMGYHKFKQNARFVLQTIREKFGDKAADALTIDHLSGAYVVMSGKYRDQGADSRKDVLSYETLDDVLRSNDQDTGENHAADRNTNLERDRRDAESGDGMGAEVVSDEPGRTDSGRPSRVRPTRQEASPQRDDELPADEAATVGAEGDRSPFAEPPGAEGSPAGDQFGERGHPVGIEGAPIESIGTAAVKAVATTPAELTAKRQEQRNAPDAIIPGNLANIAATLPMLHPGQQTDVQFAETRFAKPDGYGVLFTNGTGTGKTYTGLGIIKRFALQGKGNIIIVVPSDKIAADWTAAGKNLQLDITNLPDTRSNGGQGVVVTTYANFGQNDSLARRAWDLVVTDESHYLNQNASGENTLALDALRAITGHPAGLFRRTQMLHRDLFDQVDDLNAQIKFANQSDMQSLWDKVPGLEAKRDALYRQIEAKREAIKAEIAANQGAARPRVTFLSATPFAYEKNVFYAENYLFQLDPEDTSGRYNSGSSSDRFMMQHFGYRMRTNKLTAPEAGVDSGLMQRQFNAWLKQEKVLSGRMLDTDQDYDRRFVLTDSEIGNKIDEGLEYLWKEERFRPIGEAVRKKFDHLTRRFILEGIKAQAVIPIIREHLALGRKVVVFHDFKKGGAINPFRLTTGDFGGASEIWQSGMDKSMKVTDLIAAFNEARPDLVNLPIDGLPPPLDALARAFGDAALFFNGDVPKADRRRAVEQFQQDDSGKNLIIVQSAAGKEGISLHDTTGKHQRVLINLGLPTQPTTSIQQEGRIYRVGQASNAIQRYLTIGTNWERYAFAETIARRSSTAENLALGEQARALMDSFIQAYEEADTYAPGHENEGIGGKERDRLANDAITAWDRAVTNYFAQTKKNSRTKAQEGVDYFPTPEPLGLKMVEWADIRPGDQLLEPSAGHGAIARWFPELNARTVIEPSPELGSRLKLVSDAKLIQDRFENHHLVNKYDAIVMNSPFGTAGRTAIDHVAKAAQHLRDGGRIVALIPTGPAADKKFEKWFYEEETRQVKPLVSLDDIGEIYKGDTLITHASWMPEGIVTRLDTKNPATGSATAVWMKKPGSNSESLVGFAAITENKGGGKRRETYRPAENLYLAADIKLPLIAFERAGTSVAARVVVIEKQTNPELAQKIQQQNRDYASAETIKEFFAQIKDASIRERTAPVREVAKEIGKSPSERSGEPDVPAKLIEHITQKGKTIRGIVRKDLTKDQAQSIDPYTFKKNGGWFIREKYLSEDAGAKLSRPTSATSGKTAASPQAAQAHVAEKLGKGIDTLVTKGILNFTPGKASWPAEAREAARSTDEAVYLDGQAFIDIESTPLDRLVAVALHEIGEHHSLKSMLGANGYAELQQRIRNLKKRGDPVILQAWAQVAHDYDHLAEGSPVFIAEVIAKVGETAPQTSWYRRLLAKVKSFLMRIGLARGITTKTLTDADIHDLLVTALRSAARAESGRAGPMFNRALPDFAKVEWRVASTFEQAREAAKAFQGRPLHNLKTGRIATVSRNNMDKMLSKSAVHKSESASEHAAAVANLDRLFHDAVLGWSKPDREENTNIVAIHRFFAPMMIDGKARLVKLTVKEFVSDDQGSKIYSVETIEVGKDTPTAWWVDATVREEGLDPTSIRSVGDVKRIAHDIEAFNRGAPLASRPEEYQAGPGDFWKLFGTQSPWFKNWFGKSKMVKDGKPLVFYHGTNTEIDFFDDARLGEATKHETAGLGHFFARDEGGAKEYAQKAAEKRGGKATVGSYYLSLQNPLVTTVEKLHDRMAGRSPATVRALLRREGYDGIYIRDAGYAVAFDSAQAKSTQNGGSFDPADKRVMFSRPSAAQVITEAGNLFTDIISQPGTFNFLNKSVNTQFHKAMKSPKFGKFWNRAHQMFQDTNRASSRPADLAPSILPKFDLNNWKEAIKTLAGKDQVKAPDLLATHDALMAGTLFGGGNPLLGKLFKRAELLAGINTPSGGRIQLTPQQADLYFEARAAVDASITETAASTAWTLARKQVGNDELREYVAENPADAPRVLDATLDLAIEEAEDELATVKGTGAQFNRAGDSIADMEKRIADLKDIRTRIKAIFDHAHSLRQAGYMPAHRFGKYRIVVTNDNSQPGEDPVRYVSRYETAFEANRARRDLLKQFPGNQGYSVSRVEPMDPEAWKLFKGVNPETIMLFAEQAGVPTDEVMQEWYKEAVSSRSALSRLAHRQGYAGYSRDLARSLAAFITSNGRYTGNAYHLADLQKTVVDETQGDIKEEERKLLETLVNDSGGNDFASQARGLMATWYLLGSLGSAFVNSTQTITMTWPWLVGNGAKTATHAADLLGKSYASIAKKDFDPEMTAAILRAEQDGTIASSEVFHLYQEAMRPLFQRLGGGPVAKKAQAFAFLWGAPFSMAEHLNRKATFVAAYRLAKEQGKPADEAFRFAEKAIMETQGIYALHNRPNWAREGFGSLAFTFKQFTIAYLEMVTRMAQSGPEGRKAAMLALGVLVFFGGMLGLPGEDDLEDLYDTAAQAIFGKAHVSRVSIRQNLERAFGKEFAGFIQHGISEFLPFDISGRMGLGNLLPGTALLKPSEKHPDLELAQFFGPAGSMAANFVDAARVILNDGDLVRASRMAAPKAVGDLLKGIEMGMTGEARNNYGGKMVDATALDAIFQAAGLQPSAKAKESAIRYPLQEVIDLRNKTESDLAGRWARAIVDRDQKSLGKIRETLADWNRKNPKWRIEITQRQLNQRVANLRKGRDDIMAKNAPREIRGTVREMLNE